MRFTPRTAGAFESAMELYLEDNCVRAILVNVKGVCGGHGDGQEP